MVNTNNIAMSYFTNQPKFLPKQAHWRYFLVEFDMSVEYRMGHINVVANDLSKKA